MSRDSTFVEAMGLEPTNLLTASQALYQLSYAPAAMFSRFRGPAEHDHPTAIDLASTFQLRPRYR
jgi:hypothetical protein